MNTGSVYHGYGRTWYTPEDKPEMNKRDFWKLGFPRGINSTTHTHLWLLYCGLNNDDRRKLIRAIETMPKIREEALY